MSDKTYNLDQLMSQIMQDLFTPWLLAELSSTCKNRLQVYLKGMWVDLPVGLADPVMGLALEFLSHDRIYMSDGTICTRYVGLCRELGIPEKGTYFLTYNGVIYTEFNEDDSYSKDEDAYIKTDYMVPLRDTNDASEVVDPGLLLFALQSVGRVEMKLTDPSIIIPEASPEYQPLQEAVQAGVNYLKRRDAIDFEYEQSQRMAGKPLTFDDLRAIEGAKANLSQKEIELNNDKSIFQKYCVADVQSSEIKRSKLITLPKSCLRMNKITLPNQTTDGTIFAILTVDNLLESEQHYKYAVDLIGPWLEAVHTGNVSKFYDNLDDDRNQYESLDDMDDIGISQLGRISEDYNLLCDRVQRSIDLMFTSLLMGYNIHMIRKAMTTHYIEVCRKLGKSDVLLIMLPRELKDE